MSEKLMSTNKARRRFSSFLINIVLIVIALCWLIPSIGVLVTSFRDSRDIFSSGWWTVLPHMGWEKVDKIILPDAVDPEQPITIEGKTATFEEWRVGIETASGRMLKWYGNRRTLQLDVMSMHFITGVNLTLEN